MPNANLPLAMVGIYSVALSVSRLVLQVSIALRTALQPRLVAGEQDSAVRVQKAVAASDEISGTTGEIGDDIAGRV